MTISSLPLIDDTGAEAEWPDEVVDLTDRRRLLLLAVLGVEVSPDVADAVFDARAAVPPAHASSTTMRSAGRSSSTDDR